MPDNGAPAGPEGSALHDKRLVSWKEIAFHLGREVRTVQRWEKSEGLPVRRHEHLKKSTVYAYAGELDEWFRKRQPADDPEADAAFVPEPDALDAASEAADGDSDQTIAANLSREPSPPRTVDSQDHKTRLARWLGAAVIGASLVALLSAAYFTTHRASPRPVEKVRLVVLPFTNLSGDSKPDYITAGLTDVIRTKLSQLDPQHLGVIAASSSNIVSAQPLAEIGRILNVNYVLEGSVQKAGSQARINVKLIQISDQTHLWADSFTRELSDVLQVESDVSAAIAKQVLTTLPILAAPQPQPAALPRTVHASSPEVANSRHAYHRGKFAWGSRGDLPGSIHFFEEAIHDDPSYAEAYAGLAAATAILAQVPNDGMLPRDANPKAKDAAQRALQLNPRLSEAHAVLGNVAMSYDWDLAVAETELRRAIELNPNDPTAHEWYGQMLMVEGRNNESLTEARHALDLDPVSPIFLAALAETYYYGRAYDAAIEEAQQVVKLHPDFLPAQFWLGSAYREKKMYAQAIERFQSARQLSHDNPAMVMAYGHAQALAGNAPEARKALQKLEQLSHSRFVPSLYPAAIHVGLGETDEAFRLLNLAYQERIDRLIYLSAEPMADPLRSDLRFAQLMAKIAVR